MTIEKEIVLKQIDDLLNEIDKYFEIPSDRRKGQITLALTVRSRQMIVRLSPKGSEYISAINKTNRNQMWEMQGVLQALHADYEAGYMVSLIETINADLFSDMLEAASHFLEEQKMKLVAAVMAGGVLEEHIRKLCVKNGIDLLDEDSKPLTAAFLRDQLKKEDVYGNIVQSEITSWQKIRNKAAHNKVQDYTETQVRTMIDGIRGFILKYPA